MIHFQKFIPATFNPVEFEYQQNWLIENAVSANIHTALRNLNAVVESPYRLFEKLTDTLTL